MYENSLTHIWVQLLTTSYGTERYRLFFFMLQLSTKSVALGQLIGLVRDENHKQLGVQQGFPWSAVGD